MENKADYAELRRLYFGPREINSTPSHSKVSTYETGIDQSAEGLSSNLHDLLNEKDSFDETLEPQQPEEITEFKSQISQRSTEIINALYDKYGNRTYNKITSMIQDEDFSDWEILEQELLGNQINPDLIGVDLDELDPVLCHSFSLSESYEDISLEEVNDDLDYLDALVQHDYSRLRKFQSDQECLSSIFSEIIENEQVSNKNYQDDVFNRNIELIFNSDVDLDSTEWISEEKMASPLMQANLDEAINQLKQQHQEPVMVEESTVAYKQAELDAFYAEEQKQALEKTQLQSQQENSNESIMVATKEKQLSPALMIYIGVTCIVLVGIMLSMLLN